ncbi:hypothetical protein [Nostoc sp.]
MPKIEEGRRFRSDGDSNPWLPAIAQTKLKKVFCTTKATKSPPSTARLGK